MIPEEIKWVFALVCFVTGVATVYCSVQQFYRASMILMVAFIVTVIVMMIDGAINFQ